MNLGKETETLEFKKTTGEMKAAMISISSILKEELNDIRRNGLRRIV